MLSSWGLGQSSLDFANRPRTRIRPVESRYSRWSVTSRRQRNRAVATILLHVGTAAWALVRLRRRPTNAVAGRRWMWVVVVAVNLAAGTLWRRSRLAVPSPAPS